MNNRIKSLGLVVFYLVTVFFMGCIPENTLEWSDDGSVGLLRVDGTLYLVNGQTGQLTEIAKEDVQPWPDISKDGSLIAYSREVDCDNLSEGLKLLPPGQVKMIKYNAKIMGEDILEAGSLGMIDKFPVPYDELLEDEQYRSWAIRYMVENADSKLLEILADEVTINPTISIGVTSYVPGKEETGKAEILDAADRALYNSKKTGRNKLSIVQIASDD